MEQINHLDRQLLSKVLSIVIEIFATILMKTSVEASEMISSSGATKVKPGRVFMLSMTL